MSQTIGDLTARNGESDDLCPWDAADDCEGVIDVRSEDIVALAADGVGYWSNSRREWSELEPAAAARVAESLDDEDAATLYRWMARWWDMAARVGAFRVQIDARTGEAVAAP